MLCMVPISALKYMQVTKSEVEACLERLVLKILWLLERQREQWLLFYRNESLNHKDSLVTHIYPINSGRPFFVSFVGILYE